MMRHQGHVDPRSRGTVLVALALGWLVIHGTGFACRGEDRRSAAPSLSAEVAAELMEADRAFLEGDDGKAQVAFARVLARSPDFKPALWGRAVALLRIGRGYQALPLLDAALGPAPGPAECYAAAQAVSTAAPISPPPERLAAARRYLERAGRPVTSDASDPGPAPEMIEARVWLAWQSGRAEEAAREWQALVARRPERYALVARPARGSRHDRPPSIPSSPDPEQPWGGDWERVRLALAACLALGMAWALGLGFLFVLGNALSRATLRLIEQDGQGLSIPRSHAFVRRLYRAIIRASAVYYYVSVGVIGLIMTAVPAGVLYGLATSPHVSGWAVPAAVPLSLVMVGLWVPLVRSLRVSLSQGSDGRPLRESEGPALWALVREVAHAVGTRPVDEIRLVTGTRIGAHERGRPRDKREGRSIRCLMLGMATFDEFPPLAFRALLAHEYAHFLHGDTAPPALASRVAARLDQTLGWIAFWKGNAWWNIGWHFVSAYRRFFRRVTRGATRFAEVHADRVSALAYGATPAAQGLLHVIRREAEHDEAQDRAFLLALGHSDRGPETSLRNTRAMYCRAVAARIQREMNAPPHLDHTHPTPARRLELLHTLGRERAESGRDPVKDPAPPAAGPGDELGIWSLFADPAHARAEFQRRCEAEVQARLDAHAAMASMRVAPFTEAILDRPDLSGPYFARAEVLYELGDLPDSACDLDVVIKRDPHNARAWYARGRTRMRLGDLADAAGDLREAIRIARVAFEPAARDALGDLAAASGDLSGAVAEYSRAIDLDRRNPEVFLKRANARLRLGKASLAVADFARAAELDPGSAEAQVGLAAACEASGDHGRALAAAEAAVAIDGHFPDGHLLLARLLLNPPEGTRPDIARATAQARKAVALTHGTDPSATELLARASAFSPTDEMSTESRAEGHANPQGSLPIIA
jgi:tetratricopeptide (TPR) repeat protein